jgi:cell division protein FtsL
MSPEGTRMRSGRSRERRSIPKSLKLALLLLVGLALVSLVGNRGLLRLYELRQEKVALEREVQSLDAGNAHLREEARALRSDPNRIEAIAREELGLVKPGEQVFQFPAAAPPAR